LPGRLFGLLRSQKENETVERIRKESLQVKARTVLIVAALALVAAAGILIASSFFWLRDMALDQEKGLPEGEALMVRTRVENVGVRKGDAFFYVVEVWYDPEQVSEIDKPNLGKSVHLEPFEIRDTKEKEFDVPDSGTRVYQRKYEIQLLEGKVDSLYKFPTLTVRYRLKDGSGFLNKPMTPQTVYVSSRLPSNVSGLQLKPLKGKIQVMSQEYLTWILLIVGGFLALLGIIDLSWRALPQWKGARIERRAEEGVDVLSEAYRALHANIAHGVEVKLLLHQIDHILRILLAHKDHVDWLDGANLDRVASDIRPTVVSLLEKCQKAYIPEPVDPREKEEALTLLENILEFYFSKREVEAWKS
jgi:hypothetical protein